MRCITIATTKIKIGGPFMGTYTGSVNHLSEAHGQGTYEDKLGFVWKATFRKNKVEGFCHLTNEAQGIIIIGEMEDSTWNNRQTVYNT